jgi:hypothetical protein
VYDPVHGKLILFSGLKGVGEPPLDDLWLLDVAEGTWHEASLETASTEAQEGSAEPATVEEEGDDRVQNGVPGFTLPSMIAGLALVMFLTFRLRKPFDGSSEDKEPIFQTRL